MSMTPPPTTPPPTLSPLKPSGTPIHSRSRYLSELENRSTTLLRLALEMRPFVVGLIPAEAFLERFLPTSPDPSGPLFAEGMFDSFVKAISEGENGSYILFVSSESMWPTPPV